ncbi:uncharacterized protein LOC125501357 [Athalia rosae]|uniref:uncharacterized protein LOC125501357 n=1 Tax=Athalia rosae TaxID=37344 RepID=UPI00203384B8|nr:uncharacterized protein LOC125501357 [Athalia rosae]
MQLEDRRKTHRCAESHRRFGSIRFIENVMDLVFNLVDPCCGLRVTEPSRNSNENSARSASRWTPSPARPSAAPKNYKIHLMCVLKITNSSEKNTVIDECIENYRNKMGKTCLF